MKKLFLAFFAVSICFYAPAYSGSISCHSSSSKGRTYTIVDVITYPFVAGVASIPIVKKDLMEHKSNVGFTYIIVTKRTETITTTNPATLRNIEEVTDDDNNEYKIHYVDIPDVFNDNKFDHFFWCDPPKDADEPKAIQPIESK